MNLADPQDPRVARLLKAGWMQVEAFGQKGWWRSADARVVVQDIAAAIRSLNESEQARAQPGEG